MLFIFVIKLQSLVLVYYFFTILATIYCSAYKENNHIPDEEHVLLSAL
jgi:hypothetical protein